MGVNQRDVDRILEMLDDKLPRVLQWTTALTLTDIARRGRLEIPNVMRDRMHLRNKGFVKHETRYKKAPGYRPINRQSAFIYTIGDLGTGWIEQPVAGVDKRQRKWTKKSRPGGVKSVKGKYRFYPGRRIPRLSSKKGERLGNIRRALEDDRKAGSNMFDRPYLVVSNNKNKIYPGVIAFTKTRGKDGHFMIKRLATTDDYNVMRVDILGRAYNRAKIGVERDFMFNLLAQIKRVGKA